MNRGLGAVQRQVVVALAALDRSHEPLWPDAGNGRARSAAAPSAGHERACSDCAGRRIEIWKLRRDTGLAAGELSRVLRRLQRRGYIELFASAEPSEAPLAGPESGAFVRLTEAGANHLRFRQNLAMKG